MTYGLVGLLQLSTAATTRTSLEFNADRLVGISGLHQRIKHQGVWELLLSAGDRLILSRPNSNDQKC